MRDWDRLGGAQVFALTQQILGHSPGGREAAPALFVAPSADGPGFAPAHASILSIPAWAQAAGAILLPACSPSAGSSASLADLLLVWIAPLPQAASSLASQLTLDLPAGRYAVTTYDAAKYLAVGSEIAYGPPVVCGPPFDGAAVAVVVRPWPSPSSKVMGSEIHRQPSC